MLHAQTYSLGNTFEMFLKSYQTCQYSVDIQIRRYDSLIIFLSVQRLIRYIRTIFKSYGLYKSTGNQQQICGRSILTLRFYEHSKKDDNHLFRIRIVKLRGGGEGLSSFEYQILCNCDLIGGKRAENLQTYFLYREFSEFS